MLERIRNDQTSECSAGCMKKQDDQDLGRMQSPHSTSLTGLEVFVACTVRVESCVSCEPGHSPTMKVATSLISYASYTFRPELGGLESFRDLRHRWVERSDFAKLCCCLTG